MKISALFARILLLTGLFTMVAVPSVNAGSKHSDDKKESHYDRDHDKDDYDHDDDDSDHDHDNNCPKPPMLIWGSEFDDKEDCINNDIPEFSGLSPTIYALPATR